MLLKKIAVAIERKQNSLFTYPKEKQEAYIRKLGRPADEIERGYFQYCCQMKLYGWPLFALLNVAALPLSLLYLVRFKKNTSSGKGSAQCIFFNNGIPENIVPPSLRKAYPDIQTIQSDNHYLDNADFQFLKEIFKRYPFSWMFWLKTIHKVSRYSAAIKQFTPSAILCCDEFSFTSSVMTKYCREKGIKLINVMHGEKLYFMRDSFVCYDEYYVWNQYYADLLIELGAEPSQFKIEIPDSLKIPRNRDVQKEYDYTYYLMAEDKQTLLKIVASLKKIQEKGKLVAVRPHPRYSDMETVKAVFEGFAIEDTKTVSIEKSILRTKTAISLYSTVLNQAANNAVKIVIDDVSDAEKFSKLEERKYCMLKEEHQLLSALVGDCNEKTY